jgi:hypothetical protein
MARTAASGKMAFRLSSLSGNRANPVFQAAELATGLANVSAAQSALAVRSALAGFIPPATSLGPIHK